jgi:hypothetical protein
LYSLFFVDVSVSTLVGLSMIWILIGDGPAAVTPTGVGWFRLCCYSALPQVSWRASA